MLFGLRFPTHTQNFDFSRAASLPNPEAQNHGFLIGGLDRPPPRGENNRFRIQRLWKQKFGSPAPISPFFKVFARNAEYKFSGFPDFGNILTQLSHILASGPFFS
ncbi:MAG TPA: hypothetical protein IGS52_25700 [Oscillatoriaceae cyanobacterium M33_DOE_052]|nr:hypothetical protein [Oscillatoriaceae cyanobacterium M33_DOE_052]